MSFSLITNFSTSLSNFREFFFKSNVNRIVLTVSLYSHYGDCIKQYGPPIAYWTGRFESKHRIAKESFQNKGISSMD